MKEPLRIDYSEKAVMSAANGEKMQVSREQVFAYVSRRGEEEVIVL